MKSHNSIRTQSVQGKTQHLKGHDPGGVIKDRETGSVTQTLSGHFNAWSSDQFEQF